MTIYIGGAAAHWVCLAFVLSIPNLKAVLAGTDKDPIVTLLRDAMGEAGFRAVIVVVLVSFISCLLSLQAAASRLLFAYARDHMIFGSRYLSHMTPGRHMPLERAHRHGRDTRGHRAVGAVAAGRDRHHHQLRRHRHLYLLPDDRARGADRARARAGARRDFTLGCLGLARER